MRIDFHGSPEPTLGVEWELALVDRRTRDLRNDATHLFARAKPRLADPGRLHQELLRNTVEIVSGGLPHGRRGDGRRCAAPSRRSSRPATSSASTCSAAAPTPSRRGPCQQLSEGHRYEELINRTQWWGRQMLIWGVHVHVGLPERRSG